jgi:two-component system chemotaxis response regulator CheY
VCAAHVDLSSVTVLTLDDDHSMRSIIREALKASGCRHVLATGEGRVALEMLGEHRVGLAICDMQMDPMDGLTFMHHARNCPGGRNMAAVMLTAGKQPADTAALALLNIGAWLFKPISTTKLLDGISSVLGGLATLSAPAVVAADNIAAIGRRYAARLDDDITRLETVIAALPEDPAALREAWDAMRKIAHSVKGQAGTFGYALVTDLAGLAQDVLDDALAVEVEEQARIEVHRFLRAIVTAMRMLERGRVLGDGGEAGVSLLEKLDAVILPMRQRLQRKPPWTSAVECHAGTDE